ncbi:Uncharacterized protein APZ42_001798 [Daphnia magna]|uniref:Uncharacterized protein n=1 Tax=Daphnia magna TaxID=35525 RepID=A0A0P5UU32_9CRUS|nr:Uncharacterized protein APZ42_001798 [Daphnia magna]
MNFYLLYLLANFCNVRLFRLAIFAAANFSWTCVDPVRTKGPLFTCAIRFGSLANEFHHLKQRESESREPENYKKKNYHPGRV